MPDRIDLEFDQNPITELQIKQIIWFAKALTGAQAVSRTTYFENWD